MLPATFPLALYRGDSLRFTVAVWQDAAKTIPADLTGVVPAAEIRNAPGGLTIVTLDCTLTLPNLIAVHLPAAASKLVPPKGAWDLQLTYLDGDVQTILAGAVTQTPDITDSTGALVARGRTPAVAVAVAAPRGF